MAAFADLPEFQALHLSPLPLVYEVSGTNIEFPSADGKPAKGYLVKSKKKSNKWLFVYQEWRGLNDYVKNNRINYIMIWTGRLMYWPLICTMGR